MTETPADPLAKLSPRRRAFVENYTDPSSPTFSNASASIAAAGVTNPTSARVLGSRELAKVDTQEAIRDVLAAAGVSPATVAGHWARWMADSDSAWSRSPAVRTSELAARALGMLSETTINVDARSILLPAASALSVADLEDQLRALERAETEGNEAAGG